MAPIPLSAARVLAVDDDDANLRVLRRLLQRAGCTQVETTADPTQACALIAAFAPDLVLLDLNMPVMDGFQVLRELRAMDGHAPRVVVLSGEDPGGASTRVLAGGAQAFVAKPFDAVALLKLLHEVLNDPRHAPHPQHPGAVGGTPG
ncbi:MAG TPA: response regulator [Longimicrobiaceae bacterium]|nr:response regulator [Longimicrobiaceae bacterium]